MSDNYPPGVTTADIDAHFGGDAEPAIEIEAEHGYTIEVDNLEHGKGVSLSIVDFSGLSVCYVEVDNYRAGLLARAILSKAKG